MWWRRGLQFKDWEFGRNLSDRLKKYIDATMKQRRPQEQIKITGWNIQKYHREFKTSEVYKGHKQKMELKTNGHQRQK